MMKLEAGVYLLREGDPPTCGYLIESGRLEVLLERDGAPRTLAILGPGELVGEMALVDNAPRTANVRAIEACELLPITPEHVAARLAGADPILRLVLGTVLDRFRTTLRSFGGEAAAPTPARDRQVRAAALAELRLEKELRTAIDAGQLAVHYQPIVSILDQRLIGFEALARWSHPDRGLIPPDVFIPVAEASGLSADVACFCLAQVSRDVPLIAEFAATGNDRAPAPKVSINISGNDLTVPGFIARLGAIAQRGAAGTRAVTLELTETALVQSPSEAASALDAARALGFRIAVDDFGTGYSSLNYIRTLPVDCLKIDRTFVQGMSHCANTRSIVASMIQLAHQLDLEVVGEGIETEDQRMVLEALGCELGQGYLFGRPAPLAQTIELAGRWRRPAKIEMPVILSASA